MVKAGQVRTGVSGWRYKLLGCDCPQARCMYQRGSFLRSTRSANYVMLWRSGMTDSSTRTSYCANIALGWSWPIPSNGRYSWMWPATSSIAACTDRKNLVFEAIIDVIGHHLASAGLSPLPSPKPRTAISRSVIIQSADRSRQQATRRSRLPPLPARLLESGFAIRTFVVIASLIFIAASRNEHPQSINRSLLTMLRIVLV